MARKSIYPAGIQTFSEIREEGYLYVDKTAMLCFDGATQRSHAILKACNCCVP